jgi:hypothetical protein
VLRHSCFRRIICSNREVIATAGPLGEDDTFCDCTQLAVFGCVVIESLLSARDESQGERFQTIVESFLSGT